MPRNLFTTAVAEAVVESTVVVPMMVPALATAVGSAPQAEVDAVVARGTIAASKTAV